MHRLRSIAPAFAIAMALALGLWASPQVAHAATITAGPNGTHATIQAAVNAASGGDVIHIEAGTFTENLVIAKSVTLLGGFNAAFNARTPRTTIIDGSTTSCPAVGIKYDCGTSLLSVSGGEVGASAFTPPVSPDAIFVTLDGIEITGGSDGGIHIETTEDSRVQLIDLLIEDNDALLADGNGNGGGVHATLNNRATLIISATDIISNVAQNTGGGLYVDDNHINGSQSLSSTVIVHSSVISDNYSSNNVGGAGVDLKNFATVKWVDTLVQGNEATNSQGGLDIRLDNNSSLDLIDLSIIANKANSDAGGYVDLDGNIDVAVINLYVGYNVASSGNSGLEFDGEENVTLVADRMVAEHNQGTGNALTVELRDNGYLTVTQLISVTHNTGTYSTGGLRLYGNYRTSFDVADLYAERNECDSCSGGGAYIYGSNYRDYFMLHNVTFISNTNTSGSGGGVYTDMGDGDILTIAQGRFEDNYAGSGGGIYISSADEGAALNLRNITFITNTAAGSGGGLYKGSSYDGTFVFMEDLRFEDNYSVGSGGGAYISSDYAEDCSAARFNRNLFLGNTAGSSGGGLYMSSDFVEGCDGEFKDNTFRDNKANGGDGGGFRVNDLAYEGGTVHFTGNTFADNESSSDGGGARFDEGVYDGGKLFFSHNVFSGNKAGGDGGGAHYYKFGNYGAYVTFTHNEFVDNVTNDDGGGAYVSSEALYEGGYLTFTHNIFARNVAVIGEGGGFMVDDDLADSAGATFAHNEIVDNMAGDDGGGMHVDDITHEGSRVHFRDNILSRNVISGTIGSGGGLKLDGTYDGDMLWFTGNVITGNVAPEYGGGVHFDDYIEYGSYFNFSNNVITENYAGEGGGGCWFDDDWEEGVDVPFLRNDISRNVSGGDGGGCYFDEIREGASVNMSGNRFNDNTAADDGGALYFDQFSDDGAELILRNSELLRNRAGYSDTVASGGDGGAIYMDDVYGGHAIKLIDNRIIGNRAYISGTLGSPNAEGGHYGALALLEFQDGALLHLEGNEIRDNIADASFGGVTVELEVGRLVAEGNTIAGNTAAGIGSGLVVSATTNAEAIIDSNVIMGNVASAQGGLTLFNEATGSSLYGYSLNNLVADNSDGVVVANFPYYSINDTIANNGDAGIAVQGTIAASAQLTNTIVWDNTNGAISSAPTQTVIVNFSTIQGGFPGTSNLASNPLFVNAAAGDYHLQAASPAIDSANTASAPLVDLAGLFRPVGAAADRGAYEWRIAGVELDAPPSGISGMPGASASFLLTITNESNYQDTFLVSVQNNPLGWPVTIGLQGTDTGPFAVTLNPNETAVVEVQVTVPTGAIGGTENTLLIVVKSQSNGAVVDSEEVTITAADVANVVLGPDNNGSTATGTAIAYVHTLTNQGNFTDSISLQVNSAAGWPVVAAPAVAKLVPGASTTVHVTVTVPADAGGETDVTTLTATSSAQAGTTSAGATDTTSVPQVAGVALSLGTAKNVVPGTTVQFTHRVTNTGNGPDTIALTYQSSAGWTVNGPANVTLDAGDGQTINVLVVVPANAAGTTDVTTVQATSTVNGAASATAQDTTVVATVGVTLLPDNTGLVIPGSTVVYTHTIVNTGATEDTYALDYASSAGWTVNGPDSVTVEGGGDKMIVLQITMPAASEAEQDVTTVTATSALDNTRQDSATDTTLVGGSEGWLPWISVRQ